MDHMRALFELANRYHACRDAEGLLRTCAAEIGSGLKAQAALVWMESEGRLHCRALWSEPGRHFEPASPAVAGGFLHRMAESSRTRRFLTGQVPPDLLHLDESDRERVTCALYAPLPGLEGTVGVVELLNRNGGEFRAEDAAWVEEAAILTGQALATLGGLEDERHEHLRTVERLTQLYDISRVFNSSLEMDDLLPVVVERIGGALGARACTLWLVDPVAGDLYVAQQVGGDPGTIEHARLAQGEGLVGQAARSGEGRLVADAAAEPSLADRREKTGLATLMCAPLRKDDDVLGVVEVVDRSDGLAFNEDDLFFLTNLAEQAAIALGNANRLQAERKVHQLDALLAISKEITSTLDLDRVLLTVVNQAATVLPFDRCAVGLMDRGVMNVQAVSGFEAVPRTPETEALRHVLDWVARQDDAVAADRGAEGWDVEPESGRAVLPPYLEGTDFRGFFALPLRDEEGTLGALSLESREPEFLEEGQIELLRILASQATVAVRNAQLYQQVPLIGVMQPLLEGRNRLLALPRERLKRAGVQVGALALVLVVVPWKMKTAAQAVVVPAERRAVAAEVAGVIRRVMVREGDVVAAGALLAELDDADERVALEKAQADLVSAQRRLGDAEARGDLAAAGALRLRMDMARSEVALSRDKMDKARLRAPLAGIVVTPKVEERAGELLQKGASFCELVDASRLAVSMNVPETSLDLVATGKPVSLKLNAFPTATFAGSVDRVGARAVSIEGRAYFAVRAVFANDEGRARTGMVGRAKIVAAGGWFGTGWYPVGYVLLRDLTRWGWRTAWSWLP